MQVVGSVKRTGLTLLTQRAGRIRIKEKLDKREKKKNRQKNTQRAPRKQHTHTDTRRPHGQSECGHHHPSPPPISFLCALYRGAIETSSPPGVARQLKGQKRMSNGTERDLARNADAPWNAAATEGKKKRRRNWARASSPPAIFLSLAHHQKIKGAQIQIFFFSTNFLFSSFLWALVNERFVFPKTVPHNNRAPVITESTTRDIFYFRGRAKIKTKKRKEKHRNDTSGVHNFLIARQTNQKSSPYSKAAFPPLYIKELIRFESNTPPPDGWKKESVGRIEWNVAHS